MYTRSCYENITSDFPEASRKGLKIIYDSNKSSFLVVRCCDDELMFELADDSYIAKYIIRKFVKDW